MLISLSGSFQTSPTFWLDPKNGVNYSIATQTPQYDIDSLQDLSNIPIAGAAGAPPQILGNLASISRGSTMAVVSHYNVAPVIDIYGAVQGRDLGGVATDLDRIVNESENHLPRGSRIIVRGQILTMRSSFVGLIAGLVFSIILVYLLIVVNFQSWLDPLIIISALPAALAGIVWLLFVTRTTISVPALTGLHHVHGRGHGQQHPGGEFCQGTDGGGRRERIQRRARGRLHALSAGADDGAGDDHRHGAHGARPR